MKKYEMNNESKYIFECGISADADRTRNGAGFKSRRTSRRMKIGAALICILLPLMSALPVFAAEQGPIPFESILLKNGSWETAYWGTEGRMAYRYAGNDLILEGMPDDTPEISFDVDSTVILRSIATVHSNDMDDSVPTLKEIVDGDAYLFDAAWQVPTGTITLIDEDGEVYGAFPCEAGTPPVVNGQIQPYVLWVADTGEIELEPGRYTITDSSPDTLIRETTGTPAVLAKGVDADMWDRFLDSGGISGAFQGSYIFSARDENGAVLAEAIRFGIIDNGDSIRLVGVIADMPLDQSLAISSRSDEHIRAEGRISILPGQELLDIDISADFRLKDHGWEFTGECNIVQSFGGEPAASASSFHGSMISGEMPIFYFPKPAAGLGSLGNIPGPANESQAAIGVVAPGIVALLASILAGAKGSGGPGGTSFLAQPAVSGGPVAPAAPTGGSRMYDTNANTPAPPTNSYPPEPQANSYPSTPSANTGEGATFSGEPASRPQLGIKTDVGDQAPIASHENSIVMENKVSGLNAGSADGVINDLTDREGFMNIVSEGIGRSGRNEAGGSNISDQVIGILTDADAKRRLTGRLESILKTSRGTGSTGAAGTARSRLADILDDLTRGKKSFVQANADVRQVCDMLGGQDSPGTEALAESVNKALGQVVDGSSGNMLNDLSMQVANDIATEGLGDLGFPEAICSSQPLSHLMLMTSCPGRWFRCPPCNLTCMIQSNCRCRALKFSIRFSSQGRIYPMT